MDAQQNPCSKHVSQFEVCKQIYTSGFLSKSKLSPSTKLVLIALANHFNPNKKAMFPSQEFIANQLGISLKTVQRAVKELKDEMVLIYDTKRVNHYVFTNIFFDRINLSHKKGQFVSEDKDNLSHKHIKEHKKNNAQSASLNSFKNSNYNQKRKYHHNNQQDGAKHKTPEQTKQELAKSFDGKKGSPMDDRDCAIQWLASLTPAQMRLSVIEKRAKEVATKWNLPCDLLMAEPIMLALEA